MATKTISIDLEAYDILSQARRHPTESFSQVIHRACWPEEGPATGEALLKLMKVPVALPPGLLKTLEANQLLDAPPTDPWDE